MPDSLKLSVFSSIFDIAAPFKGILLDAYGVFWGGNDYGLLPGAKEAMEQLVATDKIVGILSNTTQLTSSEIYKLQKHGLIQGKHFHFLITSGEIAKQVFTEEKLPFKTPKKKFWLFSGTHPKFSSPLSLFENSPYTETKEIAEADFIYIAIPHINGEDQMDQNIFLDAVKEVRSTHLPMVCANPDRFAHEGTPPRAVVRQGSIAAIYEELGGQVFYIGKPYSIAYKASMDYFKDRGISDPKSILMVGDTPETDIRGANNFGIASALTIKTGMMADRMGEQGFEKAHVQLPSSDRPSFFIERLGTL